MGSDGSHFNVSVGSDGQSHKTVSTIFLKGKVSLSGIEPRSFRLPLGQTGSLCVCSGPWGHFNLFPCRPFSFLIGWNFMAPIIWSVKTCALGPPRLRVPGETKRSRDLRGGRWSWTLTFAQKRSWVGRWSWAEQVGRLLLRVVQVVRQQRCNGHCLSDSVSSTAVGTAVAQCTSRWAMARGHRLNTSIVLAAVYGLSGLFRAVSAVEPFTLSSPSHSVPVPNRPTRLCGRKATLNQTAASSRLRGR